MCDNIHRLDCLRLFSSLSFTQEPFMHVEIDVDKEMDAHFLHDACNFYFQYQQAQSTCCCFYQTEEQSKILASYMQDKYPFFRQKTNLNFENDFAVQSKYSFAYAQYISIEDTHKEHDPFLRLTDKDLASIMLYIAYLCEPVYKNTKIKFKNV